MLVPLQALRRNPRGCVSALCASKLITTSSHVQQSALRWRVQDKLAGHLTSINDSDNPKRFFVQVFPWYMTPAPTAAFDFVADSSPATPGFASLLPIATEKRARGCGRSSSKPKEAWQ